MPDNFLEMTETELLEYIKKDHYKTEKLKKQDNTVNKKNQ